MPAAARSRRCKRIAARHGDRGCGRCKSGVRTRIDRRLVILWSSFGEAMKQQELDPLRREILDAVSTAEDREALEQVRVSTLGRKGRVTALMKTLGTLEAEARRAAGAALNLLKEEIETAIAAASERLHSKDLETRL